MALTTEDLQAIAALLKPIKTDIATMKGDISSVKADISRIDRDIIPKINGLYESVMGTGEKYSRLDVVEGKVDDHEHRLFAVEEILPKAE